MADISAAADVPLGNVYYYFKTKDDLVKAAVESQVEDIGKVTGSLEQDRTPVQRLKALTEFLAEQADMIAQYGCQNATLCTELHKREDGFDPGFGPPHTNDPGLGGNAVSALWEERTLATWQSRCFRGIRGQPYSVRRSGIRR